MIWNVILVFVIIFWLLILPKSIIAGPNICFGMLGTSHPFPLVRRATQLSWFVSLYEDLLPLGFIKLILLCFRHHRFMVICG